ncbi:hypothetical protein ES703_71878 [subsurface metagenome]
MSSPLTRYAEIERLLKARTVVGEPMTIEGATLIPLISVGFFFGAAAGSGKAEVKQKGEGTGGGTGAAGGVRPVAVVIIDKEGVRIEPIKGAVATAVEKIGEAIPGMMQKCVEGKKGKTGEGEKEG